MTCDSPGCHLWEQLARVGGALPTSLSSAPDPAWRDGVQGPQQGLRPGEEGPGGRGQGASGRPRSSVSEDTLCFGIAALPSCPGVSELQISVSTPVLSQLGKLRQGGGGRFFSEGAHSVSCWETPDRKVFKREREKGGSERDSRTDEDKRAHSISAESESSNKPHTCFGRRRRNPVFPQRSPPRAPPAPHPQISATVPSWPPASSPFAPQGPEPAFQADWPWPAPSPRMNLPSTR